MKEGLYYRTADGVFKRLSELTEEEFKKFIKYLNQKIF